MKRLTKGRESTAEITYITSQDHVACAFSPQALTEKFCVLSIRKVQ